MKRRAFQTVVLLILGAIVNVAVAWGCAVYSERGISLDEVAINEVQILKLLNEQSPGADQWTAFDGHQRDLRGLTLTAACGIRIPSESGQFCAENLTCSKFDCGWPMRLTTKVLSAGGIQQGETKYGIGPFMVIKNWQRHLPYKPILTGFAINTLLFSFVLWILLLLTFKARQWRRSCRGLCPACAYPIGTSPVCTECGRAVPSNSEESS
jgi:hypothetical protein